MIYYTVRENDGKFCIFREENSVSSDRYQYCRKNYPIFDTENEAYKYVLDHMSPEERETLLEELNKKNMDELVEEYDKIQNKSDFEKLFDVTINDISYDKIRMFIDYIRKCE